MTCIPITGLVPGQQEHMETLFFKISHMYICIQTETLSDTLYIHIPAPVIKPTYPVTYRTVDIHSTQHLCLVTHMRKRYIFLSSVRQTLVIC